MSEISLAEQIRCVGREIALRERVYPKWTEAGRMKQEVAEHRLAAMRAVLSTLLALEAGYLRDILDEDRRQGTRGDWG